MKTEYLYKNKEWLIEQIEKYKNVTDISIATGYPTTSLRRYVKHFNLENILEHKKKISRVNLDKHPYKDKVWLENNIKKYGNIKDLCEATNCAQTSIRRYAHEFKLTHMIEERIYDRTVSMNEDYFENINSERKAYWLGMLVADGCVQDAGNRYCMSLLLKGEDGYIVKAFRDDLESEVGIYIDSYGRHSIKVWSKKLFMDLCNLGISPRKTGKEVFPNIPKELEHHFVRGFFDGDGTIFTRANRARHKGTVGFCCQNEDFILSLIDRIEKACGFRLSYHPHKNNVFECKTEAEMKCLSIIEYMYKDATIAMLRKYNRAKEYFNYNCPSLKQFEEESKLIAGTD